MPASVRGPLHGAVIVTTVAIIAGLNMRGIGVGAKLVGITTLLKLAPLALFLVAGAFAVSAHNFVRPAAVSPAGIARSLLFALYALQGFEASLCVSGEVREPARTIPRAILLALSATTLLYVAIQFVAQGILGGALASSNVPLADALAKIHPALGIVMLAGAAVSMFGFIASDVFSNPRILFAFARDGLLPRALGRVNRQHAPHLAIAVYATLTILLALSGSFAQLAAPAALVMSLIYIAGCSASWKLVRAGVAQTGAPLGSKWIGVAATLAILGMVTMIVFASGKEMIGLLILIGLALLAYTVQTRFLHPRASGSPEPAA
jgi:amino acid transporter